MSGGGWTSCRQPSPVYPRRGRVEGGEPGEGVRGADGGWGVPLGRVLTRALDFG